MSKELIGSHSVHETLVRQTQIDAARIEELERDLHLLEEDYGRSRLSVALLRKERDALQADNARLRDFIASAQVSSGVCCCGEAMDGHSSPMSCGHSPVDMWDYAVEKLLHAPSDTSTPEQSLAEYRNKVIEECAKRAEAYAYMSQNFNALAEELRAMKEQP